MRRPAGTKPMSRYVQIAATELRALEPVAEALRAMGLPVERLPRGQLMLEGSLECPGEPVDLRLPAGTLDTVEDFGLVSTQDGVALVCGELDRELLTERLIDPLRRALTEQAVLEAAARSGLEAETHTELDGRRRLVLRRRR